MTIVIGFALFFVGHLYLATTGATPLSLIRGMFTGRHDHPADEPASGKDRSGR